MKKPQILNFIFLSLSFLSFATVNAQAKEETEPAVATVAAALGQKHNRYNYFEGRTWQEYQDFFSAKSYPAPDTLKGFASGLTAGSSILDSGMGYGLALQQMHDELGHCHAWGTTYDRYPQHEKLSTDIAVLFGEIHNSLQIIPDNSLSLITDVHGSLSYTEDPFVLLELLLRKLKKDGRLYVFLHPTLTKIDDVIFNDWISSLIDNEFIRGVRMIPDESRSSFPVGFFPLNFIKKSKIILVKTEDVVSFPPLKLILIEIDKTMRPYKRTYIASPE
jgi:SAM-dependent methyltransferase